MNGDSIILVMFSALLGVLMAFGIAYLIDTIRISADIYKLGIIDC